MNITEYIRTSLIVIVENVQGGKAGNPTIEELSLCGQIHAILEEIGDKGSKEGPKGIIDEELSNDAWIKSHIHTHLG